MAIKYLHFNNTDILRTMSKTQQRRNRSSTIAVELLSSQDFIDIHLKDFVNLNIGITKVHPEDNYTKSIGREISFYKMNRTEINIRSVTFNKTHIYVNLEEYEGFEFILRYNKQTGYSTILG